MVLTLNDGRCVAGTSDGQQHLMNTVEGKIIASFFNAGADSRKIGQEVSGISMKLTTKALPKSKVSRLKTEKEWTDFVKKFALIDQENGKPHLTLVARFRLPKKEKNKKTGLLTNFDKEDLLIVSVDKSDKHNSFIFTDIEMYHRKEKLRAFAFFTNSQSVPKKKPVGDDVTGYCYIVSIPKSTPNKPIVFNLGFQGWGRAYTEFAPSISASAEKPKAKSK